MNEQLASDIAYWRDPCRDPIKVALMFTQYTEAGLTQSAVARLFGASPTTVNNHISLLRLNNEYRRYVAWGRIPYRIAREFVRYIHRPDTYTHLSLFVDSNWTAGFADRYIKIMRTSPNLPPSAILNRLRNGDPTPQQEEIDLTIRAGRPQDCPRCGGKIMVKWDERSCLMCGFTATPEPLPICEPSAVI